MKKYVLLSLLLAAVLVLAGCSTPQQDSVEDPLSAFSIDAVVPFATASPESLATPEPTATPEPERTVEPVDQSWQDDTLDDTTTTATYSLLMRGDSGTSVQKLQQRLKELGYYSGSVDGSYGSDTVYAVKAFENALGQTQTGVASTSLQRKLYADSAPYNTGATAKTATPQRTTTPTTQPTTTTSSGYVALSRGDTGANVSKLQQRLRKLGYYSGTVDGDYGSATVAAVKKFQKALGLEQTGSASVALQKKLYASSAPAYTASSTATPTPAPTTSTYTELSYGDKGSKVSNLQSRLKALGYYTGSVDGDYGTATVTAVKKFEAAYGKRKTGIATVALQKKLFSSSAMYYEEDEEEDEDEYETLSPGDTGDAVKRLQRRLKELGYFTGDIAGNYLTKTTNAVKKFQNALGLSETGIATVALQKKLFSSDAPEYSDETETPTSDEYTALYPGDKNDDVKKMQERLTELGYYSGPVNGNYGTKTEAAVKRFEAAYDKKQTGIATVALLKKLYSSSARVYTDDPEPTAATYKTLKNGSNGSAVKKLQQRLKDLGYYDGAVNGKFGDKTEASVKLFQQAIGMEGTGIATSEMQEVLYDDMAPAVSEDDEDPDGEGSLRKGDTGDAVTKLQKRLVGLGYLTSMSAVKKGTFDAKTQSAVIQAQLDRDVETDGVATADFLEYIYSDAAEETVRLLHLNED